MVVDMNQIESVILRAENDIMLIRIFARRAVTSLNYEVFVCTRKKTVRETVVSCF